MEIKIKYATEEQPRLQKIEKGDWIDLYTAQDYTFNYLGEHKLVALGVAMELPEGYEAIIAPRSSTFGKYGLIQANSIGVIDNSYSGDEDWWMWSAVSLVNKEIYIPAFTRLCQFRVQRKMWNFEFVETQSLGNKNRGGFGSTGN